MIKLKKTHDIFKLDFLDEGIDNGTKCLDASNFFRCNNDK